MQDAGRFDYAKVQRWTQPKRLNHLGLSDSWLPLECDLVNIPIHMGESHWTLVALYPKKAHMVYLDTQHQVGGHVIDSVVGFA